MAFIHRAGRGRLWIRLVLIFILLGVFGYKRGLFDSFLGGRAPESPTLESEAPDDGTAELERLFQNRQSGTVVEVTGQVTRLLADDSQGAPHQRFIIQLPNGRTVLVAHNLDLAERVPVQIGDTVSLRGEYEWNDQGGVLHWTHHDPNGERPGGWISYQGTRYR